MPNLREAFGLGADSMESERANTELAKSIREQADTEREIIRMREARRRLDLYKDRGRPYFETAIDEQYNNWRVKQELKKFLPTADFQNVTRRIVREVATVYAEPAQRKLKTKKDTALFQDLAKKVRYDRALRKLNRMGYLLTDALAWPDVREDGMPVQRVITSDKFRAIAHPEDGSLPVAWVLDQFPRSPKAPTTEPHYMVLSADEFLWLDKDWRFLRSEVNPLQRMPVVHWSKEEPDDGILDGTSGSDIPNAHIAVTLLNARLLKHQKAGTKMATATGDTSGMARNQPMDDEGIVEAPEGVSLGTLDLNADPQSYIDTINSVIKQVAANHGIPMSVFDLSYQATAGIEIKLKRMGLKEIRNEQLLDFRPFERDLAELWSVVLDKAKHPLAFKPDGFSVDFGDVDVPEDSKEKLEVWNKLEEMGLANRVEFYLEMNPEATEEEAVAAIDRNLDLKIEKMRRFQSENSGAFGPKDSPNPPTDREGNRLQVMDGGGE